MFGSLDNEFVPCSAKVISGMLLKHCGKWPNGHLGKLQALDFWRSTLREEDTIERTVGICQ